MKIICMLALVYVSLACLAGAFSFCYAATFLQRLGLSFVSYWSIWLVFDLYHDPFITHSTVLGAFGMAIFATGSIVKTYVWKLRQRQTPSGCQG